MAQEACMEDEEVSKISCNQVAKCLLSERASGNPIIHKCSMSCTSTACKSAKLMAQEACMEDKAMSIISCNITMVQAIRCMPSEQELGNLALTLCSVQRSMSRWKHQFSCH